MTADTRIAIFGEQMRPVELDADLPGHDRYALELGRALAGLGVQVDLITRRIDPSDAEVTEVVPGLRLIVLSAGNPAPRPRRTLWISAHQMKDSFLRFEVAEGVRYDLLHGASWLGGAVALEILRRSSTPAPFTCLLQGTNGSKDQALDDPAGPPPQRFQIEQEIARVAGAIVCRTPSERTAIVGAHGADPDRVRVIPWGVDLDGLRPRDRTKARRRLGLEVTGALLLMLGKPLPRRGTHAAIRALALLDCIPGPPPQLLLAGGLTLTPDPGAGPELNELWELAAALGLAGRVHVLGRRPRVELSDLFAASDVVLCLPWEEPYGQLAREALAAGRPVLGTAVGGLADLLSHTRAGMLTPPDDPREIAASLRRLLKSPGLRSSMGRTGRALAEKHLSWARVGQSTLELFGEVLFNAPPLPSSPAPAGRSGGIQRR